MESSTKCYNSVATLLQQKPKKELEEDEGLRVKSLLQVPGWRLMTDRRARLLHLGTGGHG